MDLSIFVTSFVSFWIKVAPIFFDVLVEAWHVGIQDNLALPAVRKRVSG